MSFSFVRDQRALPCLSQYSKKKKNEHKHRDVIFNLHLGLINKQHSPGNFTVSLIISIIKIHKRGKNSILNLFKELSPALVSLSNCHKFQTGEPTDSQMLYKPAKENITVGCSNKCLEYRGRTLFSTRFGSSYLMALGYHKPTRFPELPPLPSLDY